MNILTFFTEFSKVLTKPTYDNLLVLLRGAILANGSLVSWFQWEARLHEEPGEYSGFGRPRIIGKRLPNPRQIMSAEDANWIMTEVAWYGGKQRSFLLLSGTGLW